MENHPIPQDVTGFQFKLIGSMTLKQFGYVATGGIIAFIFFQTVKIFFIKWPLVLLFGGGGAALAFLPYEGRPLDVMASHFFKALFSPNQYLYEKLGGHLSFATIQVPQVTAKKKAQQEHMQQAAGQHYSNDELKKNQQLQAYLQTMQVQPKNSLDTLEQTKLASYTAQATPSIAVNPPPVLQTTQVQNGGVQVISQPAVNSPQSTTMSAPLQPVQVVPAPTKKQATTQAQLNDIVSQKKQLETELLTLKQELAQHKSNASQTSTANQASAQIQEMVQIAQTPPPVAALQPPPVKAPQNVTNAAPKGLIPGFPTAANPAARTARPTTFARNLTKPQAASAGLPTIPDSPNIIVGLVKDPRGNPLSNLLLEIKDKDGNPIRAFKTNLLGQFASATPLSNGVYTIVFEDPKSEHNITPIQIEAKGEIMLPLEVISVDARELLRQDLFGS